MGKRLRRLLFAWVFAILLISFAFSEEKFSGNDILAYIKVLSGDKFEGRKSGLLGGERASEWIAGKFKEWGIPPAVKDGYFQYFTNPFFNVDGDVFLRIYDIKKKRTFSYGDDWRVVNFSGSGKVKGEIVFVGYGIISEKNKWNEYKDISVRDKIVLVVNGYPPFLEEKIGEEAQIGEKVENAYKNGAKGIIFVFKPGETPQRIRLSIPSDKYIKNFIAIYATENVLNFIFKETSTDFLYLMQVIDRERKPASTKLSCFAEISAKTTFDPKRKMRNVIAKIEGFDPVLKEEAVIVGAHMDHLGVSPEGDVYNGANDNASGTAVVMEVARMIKINNFKPKRTLIFALWAGEEQGLLGSRYYVDNPIFPIEKTVAYFNLDMVGHGDGKINFPGIYYGPEIWDILKKKLPEDIRKDLNPSRGGPGGSDHTSFLEKGVPGFGIMTSGYHFKYHQTRDDFDLIKPEILEKVAKFVYNSMKILADENIKIQGLREELYTLRYSAVVGFVEKSLSSLIEDARSIEFFDLDLGFLPIIGNSFTEISKNILDTLETIEKERKISVLTSPSQFMLDSRMGNLSLLLGIEDLKGVREDLRVLKMLSKIGLGYLVLKDEDLAGLDTESFLKLCGESGILLLIKSSVPSNIKTIIEGSSKPGIVMAKDLNPDLQRLIRDKKWKAGVIWKKGISEEEYFKIIESFKEGLGYENILIFREGISLKNFDSDFLKLVSLLKGKGLKPQQINEMLGQGVIDLLYKVRGEKRRVMPFIPF
ncbi:MAG: M20/M25/M40 family metallo-hydrolase [Candidatus Aminicenantia bacterium]